MRRAALISIPVALALALAATPAAGAARPNFSVGRAEKAIAKDEGKGSRSFNCKWRGSKGWLCEYQVAAQCVRKAGATCSEYEHAGSVTHAPSTWTGFDYAKLKGKRIVVTQKSVTGVEFPPEEAVVGTSSDTFNEDAARSALEEGIQISNEGGSTFAQEAQQKFEAEEAARRSASEAKRRQEQEAVEAGARQEREAAERAAAERATVTTVPSGSIVTCSQSKSVDKSEEEQIAAPERREAEQREHAALFEQATGTGTFPGVTVEQNGLVAALARAKENEALEEVELIEGLIAGVRTASANAISAADKKAGETETARIAKKENACELHIPTGVTVTHDGAPVAKAEVTWHLTPERSPPITKAVEEGKVAAYAIGEAPGYAPSQSASIPVVAE